MTGPLALFYSPDSIGLGHMRRNTAIASAFVERTPGATALLLVGSGAGAVFATPPGVDTIKLPSVQKTGAEDWRPRSLGVAADVMHKLRSELIRETVSVLRPDIFVVDHLPGGIWNELLPTLRMIRQWGGTTRTYLGLRDILDEPEIICERWRRDGHYDLIRQYYDRVLVYGDKDNYASAEVYGIEERFPGKAHYCGYVSNVGKPSKGAAVDLASMRRDLDAASKKSVVVTAGGGFDAYPMMSASVEAIKLLAPEDRPNVTMVTGPLMPERERAALIDAARDTTIELITWTNDLASYLARADLVVTMGGYNSILETLNLGKPTINIPRSGPSQEQRIRARVFQEKGLLDYIDLDALNPEALASLMARRLSETGPRLVRRVATDGADAAAEILCREVAGSTTADMGEIANDWYAPREAVNVAS